MLTKQDGSPLEFALGPRASRGPGRGDDETHQNSANRPTATSASKSRIQPSTPTR
jgi:hypothetical protein